MENKAEESRALEWNAGSCLWWRSCAHLLNGFEGLALLDAEDPAGVAVHHRRVGENIQQQHRPCATQPGSDPSQDRFCPWGEANLSEPQEEIRRHKKRSKESPSQNNHLPITQTSDQLCVPQLTVVADEDVVRSILPIPVLHFIALHLEGYPLAVHQVLPTTELGRKANRPNLRGSGRAAACVRLDQASGSSVETGTEMKHERKAEPKRKPSKQRVHDLYMVKAGKARRKGQGWRTVSR